MNASVVYVISLYSRNRLRPIQHVLSMRSLEAS